MCSSNITMNENFSHEKRLRFITQAEHLSKWRRAHFTVNAGDSSIHFSSYKVFTFSRKKRTTQRSSPPFNLMPILMNSDTSTTTHQPLRLLSPPQQTDQTPKQLPEPIFATFNSKKRQIGTRGQYYDILPVFNYFVNRVKKKEMKN